MPVVLYLACTVYIVVCRNMFWTTRPWIWETLFSFNHFDVHLKCRQQNCDTTTYCTYNGL